MDSLAKRTRNNKFTTSLQYLEKEVRDKVDFCRGKLQSIQKVGTVMSDGCRQACQSTQNNNYTIFPQCLKKVVSNEVDFLHTDKHLNFLQVDTTFFIVKCIWRGLSQVPRKIYIFLISQEKS